MKIIFSLNHFLPERLAGIEIYTFHLALSLQRAGIEVAVLIPHFNAGANDEYRHEGIRVIRYAENSENSREMVAGKRVPDGLIEYRKIIETERPQIVHFQEIAAGRGIGLFHMQAVAAMGIKVILTCHLSTYSCQTGNLVFKNEVLCDGLIRTHTCTSCVFQARGVNGANAAVLKAGSKILYATGYNPGKWNSSLGTALGFPFIVEKKRKDLLQLAHLCNKIVVLTHWYQHMLESNGVAANKLYYCAQGLTGEPAIQKQRTVLHQQRRLPLKLAFVGRISRYKGVHLLLEAMRQLPAESISLSVYGPVTEDDYARQCVKGSTEMHNVHWMGTIDPAKVVEALGDYDLLCLPSTFSEMSPLVIQEAFAAGIPVLASDVYGNSEQVQDGKNGWLFDFNNATSLTQKLRTLISDPSLVDKAADHVPATKSFSKVAEEHIQLYDQILMRVDNLVD